MDTLRALKVLVVDASGSMTGPPLESAKNALREEIKDTSVGEVAIVALSNEPRLIWRGRTEDTDEYEQAIRKIEPGGGTDIVSALQFALSLPGISQYEYVSLVVISDGAFGSVVMPALIQKHLPKTSRVSSRFILIDGHVRQKGEIWEKAPDESRLKPPSDTIVVPIKGFPSPEDRSELRKWWHGVLRDYGQCSCYALMLVLPADKEAIRYLTEFSRELHLVSGKDCLVIGLGKSEVGYWGFDEKLWSVAIQEQVFEGYSLRVAQLFDIALSDFPCLLIFRDIRSSEHILVTLRNMTAEEISEKIRSLFSVIHVATTKKDNPLKAIENKRNSEGFNRAGHSIISELRSFAGKTFDTVVEAVIKATIK